MYSKRIILNPKLLLIIISFVCLVYGTYIIQDILPLWDIITGPEEYIAEKNYSMRSQAIISLLEWITIHSNATLLALCYPILILFGLLNFKEDLNTYFLYGKHRFKSYKKAIITSIVKYSFVITVTIVFAHCLIYIIYWFITPLKTDIALESTQYISNFLLPVDFFDGRPLFYFLFITIVNDFPVIFSYSILFSSFTLFTNKNMYLFIAVPIVFNLILGLMNQNFAFSFIDLSTPFAGYYSKITDIWRYTVLPFGLSAISLLYYFTQEHKYK